MKHFARILERELAEANAKFDRCWEQAGRAIIERDAYKAVAERLANGVVLVLPLAKGYAYKNTPDSNFRMIESAEQSLTAFNELNKPLTDTLR